LFCSNSTQNPSQEPFIIMYVCLFIQTFFLGNLLIWNERAILHES